MASIFPPWHKSGRPVLGFPEIFGVFHLSSTSTSFQYLVVGGNVVVVVLGVVVIVVVVVLGVVVVVVVVVLGVVVVVLGVVVVGGGAVCCGNIFCGRNTSRFP